MPVVIDFPTFLEHASAEGGYPTDDVLRIVLPLLEQVQAVHETGKVAPLEGTTHLRVDENGSLSFDPAQAQEPKSKWLGLGLANPDAHGLEVVGERRQVTDLSEERIRTQNEELTEVDALVKHPKFLPG